MFISFALLLAAIPEPDFVGTRDRRFGFVGLRNSRANCYIQQYATERAAS